MSRQNGPSENGNPPSAQDHKDIASRTPIDQFYSDHWPESSNSPEYQERQALLQAQQEVAEQIRNLKDVPKEADINASANAGSVQLPTAGRETNTHPKSEAHASGTAAASSSQDIYSIHIGLTPGREIQYQCQACWQTFGTREEFYDHKQKNNQNSCPYL